MNYKIWIILISSFILNPLLNGQENALSEIEVVGIATKDIEPDKILIGVKITEFIENRRKVTVEEQEKQMIQLLELEGITKEQVKLSDSQANFGKINRIKKDVVTRKNYTIEAKSANEVNKIFEVMNQMKIENASIIKIDHSEIIKFQKELRVTAIRNAKEKADYLLEAIGYTAGKPLFVKELNKYNEYDGTLYYLERRQIANSYDDGFVRNSTAAGKDKIGYKNITLTSKILVKFLIE